MGPEMMQKFRDQAERFGTRFITDQATRVELATEPGGVHKVWVGDDEYQARTVILAMGAEHKKLGVPGEEELGGSGVSLLRDLRRRVLQGQARRSSSAAATARWRRRSSSRSSPRRSRSSTAATSSAPRRSCSSARAASTTSSSSPRTSSRRPRGRRRPFERIAQLRNVETGETEDLEFGGAFIAIGHEPQSELVAGQVDVDDEGYVITEGRSTRTGCRACFAAGDLVDHTYRQAVTAAGSGCQAALDAEWYLRDTPEVPTPGGHARGRPRRGAVGAVARLTPFVAS